MLRARAAAEISQIRKVKQELAQRVAIILLQVEEPVGIERLSLLGRDRGASTPHRVAPPFKKRP